MIIITEATKSENSICEYGFRKEYSIISLEKKNGAINETKVAKMFPK
jgi:hypothetical protein